jgi:NNP family nitrate/nitrite transporter-like MFS transporter
MQTLTSPEQIVSFRNYFPAILALTVIFFLNFMARFIWGPLLVELENDFGLSHTGAGGLFFYITSGYFFGVLLSGQLSSRLNHQKNICFSSVCCGAALIATTYASSLEMLCALLVVIGVTAGLYLPSGIASLTQPLAARDFSKAFSIHEIAPSLGFIIGPLLAEGMLRGHSWRGVLWPVALGLIAVGLYYGIVGRTGDIRGEPPTFSNMRFVLAMPTFWLMLVLFVLGLGTNVGVYSMLPLYLQIDRGMDQATTNMILSASRLAAVFAPLLAGWLSLRFGARPVLVGIVLLTGISTALLGLVDADRLILPLLVQPLLASAFFTPGYSILVGMVPASFRHIVIALIMPLAMLLGGGGTTTLIGAFGDAHRFPLGFISIGVLAILSTSLLYFIHIIEPDNQRP